MDPTFIKKTDSDACFHNYGFGIFFCLFCLIKNLAFGGKHVTTESLMTPLTVGWNHETPLKLYYAWAIAILRSELGCELSHAINRQREHERECERGSAFKKYISSY